jgi:hypothetical protein
VGTPFPNPFRAETQLSWSAVPEAPRVEIFDVQGRLVLRARSVDGASYRWRGTDDRGRPVAPGLYFVRITGAGSTAVRRVFKVP